MIFLDLEKSFSEERKFKLKNKGTSAKKEKKEKLNLGKARPKNKADRIAFK